MEPMSLGSPTSSPSSPPSWGSGPPLHNFEFQNPRNIYVPAKVKETDTTLSVTYNLMQKFFQKRLDLIG